MPAFAGGADSAILVLQTIMVGAMIVAAPMLIILFATDFIHLASAKFGKQINVTHLSFSSKNMVALLVLPYMSYFLVRVLKGDFYYLQSVTEYLRMLFQ